MLLIQMVNQLPKQLIIIISHIIAAFYRIADAYHRNIQIL